MDKMDLLKRNFEEFARECLKNVDLESNQLLLAKHNATMDMAMLCSFITEKCKDQEVVKKAIVELIDISKDLTITSLMAQLLELKEEPKEEEYDTRGTKE